MQPSEIAKVAVIVWTAALAVKKVDQFRSLRRGLLPFFVGWSVVLLLIVQGCASAPVGDRSARAVYEEIHTYRDEDFYGKRYQPADEVLTLESPPS